MTSIVHYSFASWLFRRECRRGPSRDNAMAHLIDFRCRCFGGSGYPEEKKSNMALAPQMQGNVSPIGGARVNLGIATPSPARFPSAQFPTRPMSPGPAILSRPQSPGPSIKAILSPPGQTVVHQQRWVPIFLLWSVSTPAREAPAFEPSFTPASPCQHHFAILLIRDKFCSLILSNTILSRFSVHAD